MRTSPETPGPWSIHRLGVPAWSPSNVPSKAVLASSSSSSNTTGTMLSGIQRPWDRKLESSGVMTQLLAPCGMGDGSIGLSRVLAVALHPRIR